MTTGLAVPQLWPPPKHLPKTDRPIAVTCNAWSTNIVSIVISLEQNCENTSSSDEDSLSGESSISGGSSSIKRKKKGS